MFHAAPKSGGLAGSIPCFFPFLASPYPGWIRSLSLGPCHMDSKAQRIQSLTREIREQLGDQNVLDALATELATQRVDADELRERLAQLTRDLEVIRTVQRARDILLPAAKADYHLRQSVTIDATAPVPPSAGLHVVEKDGKGTAFRWSGPAPTFQFELHLDRSQETVFTLHIPLWGRERAAQLRCTSDDQDIALITEIGQRVLLLSGVLPARETLGLTSLRFTVAALHTPPVPEGKALRQLGVPVLRLSAQAATPAELQRLKALAQAPAPSAALAAPSTVVGQ